ncbi:Phosphoglycerate mutase [Solidesulfovibrio carbinoliphilus subsp. oakridgensis]|uniref:Phosphoglycerate mutase n=1 Tax=Solidesulfovibrio carbinoliphilus subsp. oakridgensis TaxID=694327 RepID=G7QCU5_9BACT|nr:histidine phosphatase family protein [Solidesulfovibrio carbinoliphilus]EHJ46251.1 Phosphoglycerate mutase [Solidesulfovibrio carbinoliphilus subsp. oakridgensis]
MPVIRLIRHGQSISNAGEVTQFPGTIPLTALGQAQAEAVAASFVRPPRLVVFSTFERSVETAEPLCRRFPEVPTAVWPVEEFTYLAPRRYCGTTRLDRQAAVAAYWKGLDPESRDGDEAESFAVFWDRVEAFLARCRQAAGRVAVFSHGQFLRGVMLRILSGPLAVPEAMGRFRAFRQAIALPNAAMVDLALTRRGAMLGPVATGHLPAGMLSS